MTVNPRMRVMTVPVEVSREGEYIRRKAALKDARQSPDAGHDRAGGHAGEGE
jgi:hypothetical protein